MLEKPADTKYPLQDLLKRRWSPRAFSDRAIDPAKLGSLLEAARWAASSRNEQPWRFIVLERASGEPFERLVACLVDGNIPWAKRAPVLILVCARIGFEKDNSPNAHAYYDCGQAAANLTTQALALDLWVHQMAGFSPEKARVAFSIPVEFDPVAVLSVGYFGDPATLPENRRAAETAPRTRKPLSEIAFGAEWNKGLSL